jgi:hypothetical protein
MGADHPNYLGNRVAIVNRCAAPCPIIKPISGKLRETDLRIFQEDLSPDQLETLPAFTVPVHGRDWRTSEGIVRSVLKEQEGAEREPGVITVQDLLRDVGSPSVGYRGESLTTRTSWT